MLHHILIEVPTLPMLSCTSKVECPSSGAGVWRLSAFVTTLDCTVAKTGKLVSTEAQNLGSLPVTPLWIAALPGIGPGLT